MTDIGIILTLGGFLAAGIAGILLFRAAVDALLPEEVRAEVRRPEEPRANGSG